MHTLNKQPLPCWLLARKIIHYHQNPVESNSTCLIKSNPSVLCSKQLIFSAGETKACWLIASND